MRGRKNKKASLLLRNIRAKQDLINYRSMKIKIQQKALKGG